MARVIGSLALMLGLVLVGCGRTDIPEQPISTGPPPGVATRPAAAPQAAAEPAAPAAPETEAAEPVVPPAEPVAVPLESITDPRQRALETARLALDDIAAAHAAKQYAVLAEKSEIAMDALKAAAEQSTGREAGAVRAVARTLRDHLPGNEAEARALAEQVAELRGELPVAPAPEAPGLIEEEPLESVTEEPAVDAPAAEPAPRRGPRIPDEMPGR